MVDNNCGEEVIGVGDACHYDRTSNDFALMVKVEGCGDTVVTEDYDAV